MMQQCSLQEKVTKGGILIMHEILKLLVDEPNKSLFHLCQRTILVDCTAASLSVLTSSSIPELTF